MWTKVTRTRSQHYATPPRRTFAVRRSPSGNQNAELVIPGEAVTADRCDIYSDGNGKLAFAFGKRGTYSVYKAGPGSRARKVAIPKQFAPRIPFGTTDVTMVDDNGLFVLDLAQLRKSALAAE